MNNSEILYHIFGANLDPITFGNYVIKSEIYKQYLQVNY